MHRFVCGLQFRPERVHQMPDTTDRLDIGSERLAGMEQFPRARRAVRGIEREQLVQDRRARATGSHDEHRLDDRLVEDRRVSRPQRREQQPLPQRAQQFGARHDATRDREPRLGAQRIQEHVEMRPPRVAAEVVETGTGARRREQVVGLQGHEILGATDRGAVRVQSVDPRRRPRPFPGHRG